MFLYYDKDNRVVIQFLQFKVPAEVILLLPAAAIICRRFVPRNTIFLRVFRRFILNIIGFRFVEQSFLLLRTMFSKQTLRKR